MRERGGSGRKPPKIESKENDLGGVKVSIKFCFGNKNKVVQFIVYSLYNSNTYIFYILPKAIISQREEWHELKHHEFCIGGHIFHCHLLSLQIKQINGSIHVQHSISKVNVNIRK